MRLVFPVTLIALLLAGPARGEVNGFKVTTDKTIDASSLESIVKQVIARSNAKTNDEKAIAIYEYLHNTIFHWAYATESAPQSVGPLKVINAYGWGLCGGQHTVLKALTRPMAGNAVTSAGLATRPSKSNTTANGIISTFS